MTIKDYITSCNENGTCGNDALKLRRPPQSWCYVIQKER